VVVIVVSIDLVFCVVAASFRRHRSPPPPLSLSLSPCQKWKSEVYCLPSMDEARVINSSFSSPVWVVIPLSRNEVASLSLEGAAAGGEGGGGGGFSPPRAFHFFAN
ncbi:unnamed protein product, partial [Pylaiella littoralis]